jgi:hypothetical protein
MPSDLDIYRSAKILLDQHGDDAELRAAEKHDAMLARGDVDGMRVWRRIMTAIGELRRGVPASGERLH